MALESITFPEPVISVAIEPKTYSEGTKLKEVLDLLAKEDPTFTIKENTDTGQLIISGMGELHLDVIVTRITKDFGVEAKVGKPQVSYHESIAKAHTHTEKYHKLLAGKEHAAEITIKVEPLPRGSGNHFKSSVPSSVLPDDCQEAVRNGILNAMQSGVGFGYPTIDIGVELTKAVFSETGSGPMAFEAAATLGFDAACRQADPVILEPIMTVDIFTPSEFLDRQPERAREHHFEPHFQARGGAHPGRGAAKSDVRLLDHPAQCIPGPGHLRHGIFALCQEEKLGYERR